ncbi:MAG: alanine racemase [Rhizobiales bacterium]|nr:alanine racemase [Hyphomicrobiales bacterium]
MPHNLPPDATGLITIDLDAVQANWRALAALVAPAACGAVVKADAYGLGAAPLLLAAGVAPVLSSLAEVEEWACEAFRVGRAVPAALQIDSGLNRLGLSAAEVKALAAKPEVLAALDLRLVMSHLACADDPSDPHNAKQRAAFNRRRAMLPPVPASLAASDGLMLGPPYHFDLVRPGYALYGGQAFRGGATPVSPVVTVQARILQIRTLKAGESVGYSATWVAKRPSRIAIVSAGYADGMARALSAASGKKGASVMVAGQRAPIVGRVSMDLITVDVTDVTGELRRGELVTLIGPELPIEAMGRAAGTIGYEVLTRLGPRFVRRHTGGGRI